MLEAHDLKNWAASLPFHTAQNGESIREWADVWWRSLAHEILASGKSDPVPADEAILELGTFVNRQQRDTHHHLFHKTARAHLDFLLDGMDEDERHMLRHTLELSGAFDEEPADEYASSPGYAPGKSPHLPATHIEPSASVPPPPPSRSTTATPLNPRIASFKFDGNSFPPTDHAAATPFNPRIASFMFDTNLFPPIDHATASPVGRNNPLPTAIPAASAQVIRQGHDREVQNGILRAAAMRYADPQLQRTSSAPTENTQLPAPPVAFTLAANNVDLSKTPFNPPDRPAGMHGHALHRFPMQDVPPNRAHGQSGPVPVVHGLGEESTPFPQNERPLGQAQIAEAKLEGAKVEGKCGHKEKGRPNVGKGRHALEWQAPKTSVDGKTRPKKPEEGDDKQKGPTGDRSEPRNARSSAEALQPSPQPAPSGGKTTMATGAEARPAISGTEDTANKPHPLTDLDPRVRMRLDFQSKEMTRLRKDLNQETEAKEKQSLEMAELRTRVQALHAENEQLKADKPHPLTDIDPRITMRLNFQSKEMTRLRKELNEEIEAKGKRELETTDLNTRMEAQQAENEQLKQQIERLTTADATLALRKANEHAKEQQENFESALPRETLMVVTRIQQARRDRRLPSARG